MVHYARATQQIELQHINNIRYYERAENLQLDAVTVRNLELIEPALDRRRQRGDALRQPRLLHDPDGQTAAAGIAGAPADRPGGDRVAPGSSRQSQPTA